MRLLSLLMRLLSLVRFFRLVGLLSLRLVALVRSGCARLSGGVSPVRLSFSLASHRHHVCLGGTRF
jgi:hypothetical protein